MAEGALKSLLLEFGIGVDVSQLKKGEKAAESFVDKIKSFAKTAAAAFAIHEVKAFVEGQIEAGAQLKVTAERLGTTTDELQAMRLAAGEAGVSAETMDTSLRFLNRNIAKAVHGGGETAAAFRKMGIALKGTSGEVRPAGDVMQDMADHIASIKDPAEKTRLAMELLGRGGSSLIPLLNKGGEAFAEARKDMLDLGGGMSEDFVEAAHKAEEAQVKLKFATTSLSSTVVNALLPDVMKLVGGFTVFVKSAVDVEKKSHIVEDAVRFIPWLAAAAGAFKLVQMLRELATAEGLVAALNPVTLFVVGAVAALLAYNDLKVALEGGKSVFGDYFGATGIETLKDDIDDANDALDAVIETLKTMARLIALVAHSLAGIGNKIAGGAHRANAALVEKIGVFTGKDVSQKVADERALADADSAAGAARFGQAGQDIILATGDGYGGIGGRKAKRHQYAATHAGSWTIGAATPGIVAGGLNDEGVAFGPAAYSDAGRAGAGAPWADAGYGAPSVPGLGSSGYRPAGDTITQNITNNITVEGATTNEGTGKALATSVAGVAERERSNIRSGRKP